MQGDDKQGLGFLVIACLYFLDFFFFLNEIQPKEEAVQWVISVLLDWRKASASEPESTVTLELG